MRVLVTGGAGFIGSHVCDILLERKHTVVCLDSLDKGLTANISHNAESRSFQFLRVDLLADGVLDQVGHVDAIIHLAAAKIPRYSSAMKTLLLNSQGTRIILEHAKRHAAKVVLASTSDVYGKGPVPFSEDGDLVLGPSTSRRWAYAASKLFDEHLAYAFADEYGVRVTILRYFGSYGPRHYISWWGGPQGLFIDAALNDRTIELHGDGMQTRCFCFVRDTALATVLAAESATADNEVLNVGTTEEITIKDLAGLISRLCDTGRPLRTRLVPYASFTANYQDARRRVPDLSKLNAVLGFVPSTTLVQGLTMAIEWQRRLSPQLYEEYTKGQAQPLREKP